MAYNERLKLYEKIQKERNPPLITFVTSPRTNATAQMASDVIPEFTRQILALPKKAKEIDVLVISNGGDPTVSWRIINMMRERFDKIGVLLPYSAYSAATLLALGADEIVMHPFSNLGPVDPQITRSKGAPGQPNHEVFQFGSEDLRNFLAFVRSDVGITDQAQLRSALELLTQEVGAVPIGVAKRSSQLSYSLSEKLLSLHLDDTTRVKAIADALNTSFYHHGHSVGRTEAKEIGLPVHEPSANLEKILWQVWLDIEDEMETTIPFNPLEIALKDPTVSTQLSGPIQQLQLPSNLPPNIMQQVMQQMLSNINIVQVPPVSYALFQATLESVCCRSEFRTQGMIYATRRPDLSIAVNTTVTEQGWSFFKESSEEEGETND